MTIESKMESLSDAKKELYVPTKEMNSYSLESGVHVNVTSESFLPRSGIEQGKDIDPDTATFFVPGWGMDIDVGSVKKLAQSFAESTNTETFSLSSRAVEHSKQEEEISILHEEARALAKYILEKGKKEVNLAGHSQGGYKAISIAHIIEEEYPEIQVRGLTLLAPMGLYEQKKQSLVKNFVKDATITTPQDLGKNPSVAWDGLKTAAGLLKTVGKEVLKSNVNYFKRFNREIEEMSQINPSAKSITTPIVIISGAHDAVASREAIIPKEEESRLLEEFVDKPISDIREHYVKKNLFPNSTYVRTLFPDRDGNHTQPFLRPDAIANGSQNLIDRHYRTQTG